MNPYFYWWFHWIKISMFAPVSIPFFHTYLNCVLVKILVKSACDYGEDFIWAIYTYLCPGLPWAGPYVHTSWFTMSWSTCRCFLLISCADPYNICLLILSYPDIHMCSVMLCSILTYICKSDYASCWSCNCASCYGSYQSSHMGSYFYSSLRFIYFPPVHRSFIHTSPLLTHIIFDLYPYVYGRLPSY